MSFDPVIFREYDIRGVFNKQFDCDFAYELGQAFGTYVCRNIKGKNPTITLGHDARLSSPEITSALSNGLMKTGAKVIHLGLITTPISYFSTFTLENVSGAIMVTGSHNPPEYNGFKISLGKSTIFGEEIMKLKKIVESSEFEEGTGTQSSHDIFPSYVERYEQEFSEMQSIPIVLDCGNGAAGCIVSKLYNAVGLEPLILFEEPDGTFPNHHPDPTVEKNLVVLAEKVRETKSLIGIGFDGDADRIGIVDETGKMIFGDEIMALVSREILKDNPGQKIIGDVKCSDRLYTDIEKSGGVPIMWKTGHSLIKEKVKIENSPFGGELSGHVFFADRNYGYDDALYAGLRLCEIIAKTGKTITQLLEGFPPSFNTPEIRIDTTEDKKHSIVNRLKEVFSEKEGQKINLIDGIRVSFEDGWALARASNTQPVLVLRFEANSQEGLDRIQKSFEDVVNPLL